MVRRAALLALGLPVVVACVVEQSAPPPTPLPTATAPTDVASSPATTESAASSSVATASAAPTTSAAPTPTASGSPDAGPAGADGGSPEPASGDVAGAQYRACKVDADCVAVARVGCCPSGWKEAVAATQKAAYAQSFKCPEVHPICGGVRHYDDPRAPLCDNATHLCSMVRPEEIHCGGFVPTAHHCPQGYVCPKSTVPDAASICRPAP